MNCFDLCDFSSVTLHLGTAGFVPVQLTLGCRVIDKTIVAITYCEIIIFGGALYYNFLGFIGVS